MSFDSAQFAALDDTRHILGVRIGGIHEVNHTAKHHNESRGKVIMSTNIEIPGLEDRGLLVPGEKSIPFRVSGLLSTGSLDGTRTEVVVERAKVASKWD